MKTVPKHIVNTISFDIISNNSSEALDIQNRASGFANNELPHNLGAFFDEYSKEKGSHTFDQIEVDLGEVDVNDFPNAYMEALICQLRYKLDEVRMNNINQDQIFNTLEIQDSGQGVEVEDETEDIILPEAQKDFEILKEFILKGILPWYCDPEQVDINQVFYRLLDKNNIQFQEFIRVHLSKYTIRQRLIYQFEESDIYNLLKCVYNVDVEKIRTLIKNVKSLHSYSPFIDTHNDELEYVLFDNLLETSAKLYQNNTVSFEEQYLFLLALKTGNEYADFLTLIYKNINKLKGEEKFEPLKKRIEEYLNKVEFLEKVRVDVKTDDIGEQKDGDWGKLNQLLEEEKLLNKHFFSKETGSVTSELEGLSPKHGEKRRKRVEEVDNSVESNERLKSDIYEELNAGYYISNAGLVLLHPFIPELFKRLNYIKKGEFRNEQIREKAIHLLQYAVCAGIKCSESILILNKIICGYPIEDPVRFKIDVTTYEKSEATRMVNAAIKHWRALKSTSVPSFRRSFLHRNGLLKLSENKWKLFVERKAYDVLLDQIPWTYRTFKFSWMEYPIEVEW